MAFSLIHSPVLQPGKYHPINNLTTGTIFEKQGKNAPTPDCLNNLPREQTALYVSYKEPKVNYTPIETATSIKEALLRARTLIADRYPSITQPELCASYPHNPIYFQLFETGKDTFERGVNLHLLHTLFEDVRQILLTMALPGYPVVDQPAGTGQ